MLSINTNLSSIIAQNSMRESTNALNQAIERMSTGFKINHAKDNAANYSISTNMTTKIGSYQIAEENAAMGLDLVTTASSTLDLVSEHVQRIRDLCEQASNGTYGEESLKAIQSEVDARQQEVDRILSQAEYNGIKMLEVKNIYNQETTSTPFLKEVTRLTEEEALAKGYILVRNETELVNALNNNESVCLMNDIDMLTSYPTAFVVENYSNATIEGNGFSIKNIKLPNASEAQFIKNATNINLKNLNLHYQDVGTAGAGAFVSRNATGEINVENCSFTGDFYARYSFDGIIVSRGGKSNLKDSYVNLSSLTAVYAKYAYFLNYSNNAIVNIENCYYNKDIITSDDNNSEGAITTTEMNALLSNAYTQAKIKTGVLEKSVNLQIGTMGDSNSQISFVSSVVLESLAINCLDSNSARNSLTTIDDYLAKISAKQTEYGAIQNRLESALEEISVQYDNLVSSRSTLRDADIAEVSSHYIQQQILQQASATLMATANQSPSIALQLI